MFTLLMCLLAWKSSEKNKHCVCTFTENLTFLLTTDFKPVRGPFAFANAHLISYIRNI